MGIYQRQVSRSRLVLAIAAVSTAAAVYWFVKPEQSPDNNLPAAQRSEPTGPVAQAVANQRETPAGPGRADLAVGEPSTLYTVVDTGVISDGVLREFLATQPVERYEIGAVDADFLRNEIRRPETDYFTLRLMDEYEMTLSPFSRDDYVEGPRTGFARYMGRIVNEDHSSALFVVSPDGTVSGTIRSSQGFFRIQSTGTPPYHFVWKMDPSHTYSFD